MQKGIIDGTTGAWEQLKASRFAEVGEYECELNICQGAVTVPVLMNWDKWNSLPSDIQTVITENAGLWSDAIVEEMLLSDDAGVEFAKELGNTFYDLPPEELAKFYEILDSVYFEEMKAIDAKGYPGTEILQEIRNLVQEYSK
jgi:TRAP-type C4-dicarboxylate transport system substrate-binding protein